MNNTMNNDNNIWNPHARIPATTKVVDPSRSSLVPSVAASPAQEAARMAALKRLRHRLVTLCNGIRPPTLAVERWLSRSALARDERLNKNRSAGAAVADDVIIPSIGQADAGLVKDLSRCKGMNHTTAREIAEELAKEAQLAAQRVAAITVSSLHDGTSSKSWRQQLKSCTKAVQTASKAVQNCLKQEDTQTSNATNDAKKDGDNDEVSLQKALQTLAKSTQALQTCQQGLQSWHENCSVVLDPHRKLGICDVALLQVDDKDGTTAMVRKKPYLTISTAHLHKLWQLWQLQNGRGNNGEQIDLSQNEKKNPKVFSEKVMQNVKSMPDQTAFLESLYCCLARYETIKGAGYQCAVPASAFDAACQELGLGITIECFASPLNCRYHQYFSAFPDVEHRFGSLGSFFDDKACFPIQGSFEANPPFVPEIMYAMNDKLQRILENPHAKALSFLIVVPVWGTAGIGYVTQLEESPYCRAKARVVAAEHCFCDGAQHQQQQASSLLRPSSWDTAVILWQNDDGATKWPVTTAQLETSFCTALKRTSLQSRSQTLQEWEQRGVARGGKGKHSPTARHNSGAPQQKRARR